MSILFDIDMDFFLGEECLLAECVHPKTIPPPAKLLEPLQGTPCFLHVEHHEALPTWDNDKLRMWECWHFDAHHDMGTPEDPSPYLLPFGRRADHVTQGNFLSIALREGIFSFVHWVLPPWMSLDYAHQSLEHLEPDLVSRFFCHTWQEVAEHLPSPDRIHVAFSPAFTPVELIHDLATLLAYHPQEADRYIDRLLEKRSKALSGLPADTVFMPDTSTLPNGCTLFHGSPILNLTSLSADPLFLSTSPAVACCFGLPFRTEERWVHGVDHLAGPMPKVYVGIPKGYEGNLDSSVALYTIRGDAACIPAGTLYGYEYCSYSAYEAKSVEVFPTIREAFCTHDVSYTILGESAMAPTLKAVAQEVRADVENFFAMPFETIMSLPVLTSSLLFFLAGVKAMPERRFGHVPLRMWQRVLDRILLPACSPFFLQPDNDHHGVEHCRSVARWTSFIAAREGLPPLDAMIAACLHDAARENDESDKKHALAGSYIAEAFLESSFFLNQWLSDERKNAIIDAIARHTKTKSTTRYPDNCLCDADRLRLAWAHGAQTDCFSTNTGNKLAHLSPLAAANALAFYDRLSDASEGFFECKIEVTDACDLACSFCHQGFGFKRSIQALGMPAYLALLERLAQEGVRMLRLTGGEPLLDQNLLPRLAAAKERGFYTTLNTNAVSWNQADLPGLFPYLDCIKISFPAHDEGSMEKCTGISGAWSRKLEAAAMAAAYGVQVDLLTPMFPTAIRHCEDFARLFEQLPTSVQWLPLRAEPTPDNLRPVCREDMLCLMTQLHGLRENERWERLRLYLAMPYCFFDSPLEGVALLHGRQSCGPLASLTVTPEGNIARCYSRRRQMDTAQGILATASLAATNDFNELPRLCHSCPVVYSCMGGCRCRVALTTDGLDYLASPEHAKLWQSGSPQG